ncbi:oxygen-independent coproporphyrinogen III oxidase [Rhizobium sp. VS19-DR104.2]|uniref:oxygen-independent coproporphyrinogen III oxidase n=1 Tax=unclassified Rhizobium TaxID=2613769 RepID=UPI001CC755C9|nr:MULTISPECIES: oxygen-independent coproporphyrinogen III oxidase [unclassified Rhizobium]MBZ5761279.1 oxygen-independent coproporphyrinogen III oxidase [Rhizobium sp. VS19-DR96]MBZ5767033.1 oxygen-independent coproporphyrinogen III oxidase [Rhizobium sp. VS19-DR129.2]MBZ5774918.1 oxygen-independent coproporphyrinogen III oxidase [Rhizobium sp. VS19-DRK62.2]MBZ5785711.1 oxygen-independent coproporphyrinogen III oxidase [Rhizobium sp. VS19-DR121]MBZ5803137.1 oxygen-independent coproporphyrinog
MSSGDDIVRRYAALAVPRYTSYPTAAEFSAAVTPDHHARWLGRVGAGQRVSVYLHVPYCRELCFYCGCHTKLTRREDVIDAYRRALETEIETAAGHLGGRPSVARLHWGGGTPSILGASGMKSVLDVLHRHFTFEEAGEHAIELDPRYVDQELAADLRSLGINRASLGVQDTAPQVQAAIGRIQPIETVQSAVAHLRTAGIDRLNFDLIYGLPKQTVSSLTQTCQAVAELRPDRIACYGYAHMPDRRANQRQIDGSALPTSAERIEQAATVFSELLRHGYEAVGLDHFARPDDSLAIASHGQRLHRNFQGYTDDDCPMLLGFGASAISRLPDGYVQNMADNPRYCRTVGEKKLASIRGCLMDTDDQVRAKIIESLMCNFRVDLGKVAGGKDFADEFTALQPMIDDGLVVVQEGVVAMTAAGRAVVRVAAAIFDRHRWDTTSRFSLAV